MKRKIYKLLSSAKQGLFALALVTMPSLSYSQTTYTYGYTGAVQAINFPAGNYSIECWGADGGKGYQSAQIANGGKGGYSYGNFNLSVGQTIYIYVGGAGTDADGTTVGQVCAGGFNGGGSSGANNYATASSYRAGGGGGGTDIRIGGNTLNDRIIVAGGGGGGVYSTTYPGGNGGGASGGNGGNTYNGTGGSQTAGGIANGSAGNIAGTNGALGIGGNGGTAASKSGGGGGGGGYYGGGGGATGNSTSSQGGGGGGSGYVGGVTGGNTIMFGTTGFVTKPIATGDGYVIITQLSQPCTASIGTPTITSAFVTNSLCLHAGETATLEPLFGSGSYVGINYNWLASSSPSGPFSPVATSTNPSYVTPSVGATAVYYMVEATCVSAGVTVASGVFGVLPNPTIALSSVPVINFTLSSLTVCTNDHYTITASGASTYTWNNGTGQAAVNPYILTPVAAFPDYTVTGTSAEGCTDTNTMTIATILDAPIIFLNATANNICEGSNVILTVMGNAYMFSWAPNINSGAAIISVAPTSSTEYTVTAAAVNGCSQTATQMINVNPPPVISVITSTTPGQMPCVGEEINMAASGATTYTWLSSGGGFFQGPTVIVSPEASTIYYVNGTDQNGCIGTTIFNLVVADCVGITELNANNGVSIYPNPNNGEFVVELNDGSAKAIELYDLTGRVVLSNTARDNKVNVNINHLSNGVYYLKVKSDNATKMVKVVKQ